MKKSQKSLKNWTKEDWDYVSKGDEKKPRAKRGRYLPRKLENLLPRPKKPLKTKRKEPHRRKASNTQAMEKRFEKGCQD